MERQDSPRRQTEGEGEYQVDSSQVPDSRPGSPTRHGPSWLQVRLLCLLPSARCRPPGAPTAVSLLLFPHFLLLVLCQTHLELFKPKYSAPSPSSQIPLQFKTSPALSRGREERRGVGRPVGLGGGGETLHFCLISGEREREGGRSALGHRSISAHFSH